MLITIDGPSGVGKGTIARLLADRYGLAYLDTGLLFRRVALELLHQKGDPGQEEDVLKALDTLDLKDHTISLVDLRTEEVSQIASRISTYPSLREALKRVKQQFAHEQQNKVVFDGRDMGTVVFPNAPKKIFLTASPEVRALRRQKDLEEKGIFLPLEKILYNLQERDLRDATRSIAPTRPAEDALIIDTSHLSIEAVLDQCVSFIEK